jgi:hypothetical protein
VAGHGPCYRGRRQRLLVIALSYLLAIVVGLAMAIPTYSLTSDLEPQWLSIFLAAMAFFFGVLLLAWAIRIILVVQYWRKSRGGPE